jgi:hypothetical protein
MGFLSLGLLPSHARLFFYFTTSSLLPHRRRRFFFFSRIAPSSTSVSLIFRPGPGRARSRLNGVSAIVRHFTIACATNYDPAKFFLPVRHVLHTPFSVRVGRHHHPRFPIITSHHLCIPSALFLCFSLLLSSFTFHLPSAAALHPRRSAHLNLAFGILALALSLWWCHARA